jgi:hypothetical protein
MRSYGYDILRWLRFLTAIGVIFDEATRSDYSDFVHWLQTAGKTGGARRAQAEPGSRRLNRETGKMAPDDRHFDPATLAHSRIVLHEFYEFLLDRRLQLDSGSGPPRLPGEDTDTVPRMTAPLRKSSTGGSNGTPRTTTSSRANPNARSSRRRLGGFWRWSQRCVSAGRLPTGRLKRICGRRRVDTDVRVLRRCGARVGW